MKITFILPAIGKKRGERYIKTWQLWEPLTISTLKALTPADIETEFFDDRLELVDYDTRTDLVAITLETYTARRAYAIADRFRRRGIPVLMGGYHPTLCPDEVAEHADSVLIGSAENVWRDILNDFRQGRHKPRYYGDQDFTDILPDRTVFKGQKYSRIGLVETGRGCSFGCEFCAVTAFHQGKYHKKPVDYIVREVRAAKKAGQKFFFLVDDNLVSEPNHTIELLKALTPLKIRWTGQGALTMARNPELLKWIHASGCSTILIGYESLETKNLDQMNKSWNARLGELDDLTETLHEAGLSIYATFVFGFDHDSLELFDRTVAFAQKHSFFLAGFNHLVPMPGTNLYARLLGEGKILQDQWWLDPSYTYGALTFEPSTLTASEVSEMCRRARKKFYAVPSILKRSLALLKRNPDPLVYPYFWYANLKMQKEVDEKMGLPMGEGLDEYPK